MTSHLNPVRRLINVCRGADEVAVVAVLVANGEGDDLTCICSIEDVAAQLGKTDRWVIHVLRRLKLPRLDGNRAILDITWEDDVETEDGGTLTIFRFHLRPPSGRSDQ